MMVFYFQLLRKYLGNNYGFNSFMELLKFIFNNIYEIMF